MLDTMIDATARAWLAEARGRGLPERDILRAFPFPASRAEAKRELARLARSKDAALINTLAERIARLEWQARNRRHYAAFTARNAIPRIPRVSRREFIERFYAPQQPVVLTQMMNDWKALTKGRPAFFRGRFGEGPVKVASNRDQTPFYDLNVHAISRDATFGEFVDWVESTRESNAHYLVANNDGLGGPLRALVKDLGFFGGLMDRRRIGGWVYFWYGPGGTVTPLHHDTSNILFCQVRGKKRVTLIDPVWTELVRDCVSFYSFIDVERPDLERFPYFAQVPKRTVTVGPGEALLIPAGWWHFVRGLSTSVSISMTNFAMSNPGGMDEVMPGVIAPP